MVSEILRILETDAKTTIKQIAAMTGVSTAEVTKLVKDDVFGFHDTVVSIHEPASDTYLTCTI